ncbi:hypothetical protein O181_008876 [Austropuccinia psidii MF-1]|uniref:Retrotransposon gag domain-containing protein n=1 Tax=Austropuccinia psidii MF-1 TaxID=1389203 RepID=A0A9Q3BQN9_9BASI|nr:hypothetical protein [Austropuccinia psidii MF-1]
MQQMTKIMANIQADSSSESSSPPAFKTPSMNTPECLDGTQPFKVRSFIQSFQLIFHNDPANFCQDRNTTQDTFSILGHYLTQLFTLFGDPNEVRKAEADLDSLIMKEVGHVSVYVADFRSLVSTIGDWGERALTHHFRKGFPSRILDQLVSHPSRFDSLQDLMDITLDLDTRYHERQN